MLKINLFYLFTCDSHYHTGWLYYDKLRSGPTSDNYKQSWRISRLDKEKASKVCFENINYRYHMISGTSTDWLKLSEFNNKDCMEKLDENEDFDEIDDRYWWEAHHDI